MFTIRRYTKNDYPMLKGWWEAHKEDAPPASLLPEGSTFILCISGMPALSVTVYLTNCKEIAYIEHFIGNPSLKGTARREGAHILQSHLDSFVKSLGYNRLICTVLKEPLIKRYEELGYGHPVPNTTVMTREL